MITLDRNPDAASQQTYDLVIVGGGIYGVFTAYEAARRGLKPLLLEQNDFGWATSWNSLRIIHGGLRYLQSMDIKRIRESVRERSWFLRYMPDLVEPLTCLMPLYGRGLKRPSTFGIALKMNDWLSRHRNDNLRDDRKLPDGQIVPAAAVREMFPQVDTRGLQGAGLWYDGLMMNSSRVVMEILLAAGKLGATALNYVACTGIDYADGAATGVFACDKLTNSEYHFRAPVVINTSGPWCRPFTRQIQLPCEQLHHPSLAFNVLLDIPAVSDAAVAVAPRKPDAAMYFLTPYRGRIFAGTYHAPWPHEHRNAQVPEDLLADFLNDLNDAVPQLNAKSENVVRIFAGIQPTDAADGFRPSGKPIHIDHHKHGGVRGLFTVSGVKFTTARHEAMKIIEKVFTNHRPAGDYEPLRANMDFHWNDPADIVEHGLTNDDMNAAMNRIIRDECVVYMDDLLLRRSDWGVEPAAAQRLAPIIEQISERKLLRETTNPPAASTNASNTASTLRT